MTVDTLVHAMEQLAPTRRAEPWDNVGLLAGDPHHSLTHILLTIDYTAEVADEAGNLGCDAVIAYHPVLFDPIKKLTAGHLVFDAIRRGIAIYSPHTALDLADGGTNDVLADALGMVDRRPLSGCKMPLTPWHYLLITFVPDGALEKVAAALSDAGAGCIGNYSHCTYRSPGTGTFLPHEGAHPAIGQVGKLEYVDEIRIETIVPVGRIDAVVQALRQSHPYEEPAFDLIQLSASPDGTGMGRIGQVPPTDRGALIERVRNALGLNHVLVAGPTSGPVTIAACAAGSCGPLFQQAIAQNAQLYLTGELKHHDALHAAAAGLTVVCVLHSNSERATLRRLCGRLAPLLPGVQLTLSRADRDPFIIA